MIATLVCGVTASGLAPADLLTDARARLQTMSQARNVRLSEDRATILTREVVRRTLLVPSASLPTITDSTVAEVLSAADAAAETDIAATIQQYVLRQVRPHLAELLVTKLDTSRIQMDTATHAMALNLLNREAEQLARSGYTSFQVEGRLVQHLDALFALFRSKSIDVPGFVEARDRLLATAVPVQIVSFPSGCRVSIDGLPAGVTPAETQLRAARSYAVAFEGCGDNGSTRRYYISPAATPQVIADVLQSGRE